MPRPRATGGQVFTDFQVMPWQQKAKKKRVDDAGSELRKENSDDHAELQTQQVHVENVSLHPDIKALCESYLNSVDDPGGPGEEIQEFQENLSPLRQYSEQEDVVASDQEDAVTEPTQEELLKLCSFDDAFLPERVPAKLFTKSRHASALQTRQHSQVDSTLGSSQRLEEEHQRQGRHVHHTEPSRHTPTQQQPQTSPETGSPRMAEADKPRRLQGKCRMALLPQRVAWSGHVVDTTSHACFGMMAKKVGDVSSSGHSCGVTDDEELLHVTIVSLNTQAGSSTNTMTEQSTYVVSTGGDMSRWRPAETSHFLRFGIDDSDNGSKGDGSYNPRLEVYFEAESLVSGDRAQVEIAKFARKLCGKAVDVVQGSIRLSGMNVV